MTDAQKRDQLAKKVKFYKDCNHCWSGYIKMADGFTYGYAKGGNAKTVKPEIRSNLVDMALRGEHPLPL